MSEERVQISMSNTKKEMLEAYEALLAEVQAKSLENPKEVQTKAVQETEERLNREHRFAFDLAQKETEGQLRLKDQQIELLQQKIKEIESQLKEAGVKVANSEETVRDIALRAIDSSAMTSRTLAREPRTTTTRDTDE